jgi:type I restriction enzyme, S subunit
MHEEVALRRAVTVVNGGTPTPAEEHWNGTVPWATPVDLGVARLYIDETQRSLTERGLQNGSRRVPAGSILISTRAPIGYLSINRVPMAFNQGCKALVPRRGVDARFIAFQLMARRADLEAAGQGSTFMELSSSALADVRVALPALQEQRRIADFLDDQVAIFDRAIELRRRQVDLLGEQEIASMADALTGRCRDGSGQPTGLSWLPGIPSSWSLGPVYAFYSVRLGKMLNPERAGGEHPRPYLRNANVHWLEISTEDLAVMSFDPHERERYRVRSGDLLVCEGGAGVAEAAVWRGEVEECYYQKSLHRVRGTAHLPVEWLMFWLRVAKASGVFESEGNLATIPHLTGEQLRQSRIPVCPPGEGLLTNLRSDLERGSVLRLLQMRSAELLRERKQALITAAVTGQFDVTTTRAVT